MVLTRETFSAYGSIEVAVGDDNPSPGAATTLVQSANSLLHVSFLLLPTAERPLPAFTSALVRL